MAGIICIAEVLFVSWQLDKSPIELILQIPRIGAPYYKGVFCNAAILLIGPIGQYLVMGCFLLIAAVGCFLVRNAEDIWVRFLPALVIIPFWTYSTTPDWLVLLPCYIYILNNKQKYPRLYDISLILGILWCPAFFALRRYEMIGWAKNKLDNVLLLTILMICYIQVVLDNREQWCCRSYFHDLMFWRKAN